MSEDFDTILDRCLADVAAGRETIDSCLRHYPAQASRLAALLKLAGQVQTAPPASLPVDKRRALEARLMKRASELRARPVSRANTPRRPLWRRGIVLALTSLAAFILLLSSAVSASASSAPGDVLYPVKRASEQVRLALSPDGWQAELHLEFARQRLQELDVLRERGKVSEELLTEISAETALVLDRVPSLPPDKQRVVLMSLTDFQNQQLQVLEVMAASTRGEAQARVKNALADSATKQQQAKALLAGAAPVATPVLNLTQEPEPTILLETQAPHGKPAFKPTAPDKPELQATAKATKEPQKPTPKVERTPPGQTNQATPNKPTKEPKPTKESKK
jgi:Domain of unknown function (DUF5667)